MLFSCSKKKKKILQVFRQNQQNELISATGMQNAREMNAQLFPSVSFFGKVNKRNQFQPQEWKSNEK